MVLATDFLPASELAAQTAVRRPEKRPTYDEMPDCTMREHGRACLNTIVERIAVFAEIPPSSVVLKGPVTDALVRPASIPVLPVDNSASAEE
jgi:hypothetical protein